MLIEVAKTRQITNGELLQWFVLATDLVQKGPRRQSGFLLHDIFIRNPALGLVATKSFLIFGYILVEKFLNLAS